MAESGALIGRLDVMKEIMRGKGRGESSAGLRLTPSIGFYEEAVPRINSHFCPSVVMGPFAGLGAGFQ